MTRVGVGYRHPLDAWIDESPAEIECLEITAEHFYDGGVQRLRTLHAKYPLFVHGLGISLGTPGPLDASDLARFAEVVEAADPLWISEHVAFTRTEEVDLGHLNPIAPTEETLSVMVDHAQELSDRCDRPLILENICSHLRLDGAMPETEFLNRLCDQAGCGLLLDVTNLFINSRNHGFDSLHWLHEIEPRHIVQLHVVGYSFDGSRWQDHHAVAIQDELFDLVGEVVGYAPVQAIIVERDNQFPAPHELCAELARLRQLVDVTNARALGTRALSGA